ncbi:hypothetical protein FKM82_000098 [Ascaphus truei]
MDVSMIAGLLIFPMGYFLVNLQTSMSIMFQPRGKIPPPPAAHKIPLEILLPGCMIQLGNMRMGQPLAFLDFRYVVLLNRMVIITTMLQI